MRYSWPGNVRELENACERIAQTCTCGDVRICCAPAAILFSPSAVPFITAGAIGTVPAKNAPVSLDDRLREVEAELIGWALKASGGNKSRAAQLLQIKRSTLGDRINRCGLGKMLTQGDAAVETASSSTVTTAPGDSEASTAV
jgi:DNA-binding NtrC family response regulator